MLIMTASDTSQPDSLPKSKKISKKFLRHLTRLTSWLGLACWLACAFLTFKRAFFLEEYNASRIDIFSRNTTAFDSEQNHNEHIPVEVEQCTPAELSMIKQQLPPGDCIKTRDKPWGQTCSLTYATRCPDSVWLEDYYTKLHSVGRSHSRKKIKNNEKHSRKRL